MDRTIAEGGARSSTVVDPDVDLRSFVGTAAQEGQHFIVDNYFTTLGQGWYEEVSASRLSLWLDHVKLPLVLEATNLPVILDLHGAGRCTVTVGSAMDPDARYDVGRSWLNIRFTLPGGERQHFMLWRDNAYSVIEHSVIKPSAWLRPRHVQSRRRRDVSAPPPLT